MTEQTIAELTNFFQQFKVGGDKTPAQSNLSFDDARDYFFRNMVERGLADATMKFYKNKLGAFRKFLVQIKKVQTLELVTEEEIKYYFNSKYSKKKTGYYNCHARALRAFFNYLEKDGYLIASPAHNIKPKKVRKEKIDYFTIDQVRKMLTSFDLRYKSEIRNLLLVMILLDTGVRNSELVSKETERLLNVYRREVLKGAEKGPLFTQFYQTCNEPILGTQIKPEVVYRVLAVKAKKLFGNDVRMNPHKFRHTFATHFVINGGDAFSLRDLLGHTNIETTKIYVDMSPKDLKTKHAEHSLISNMQNDRQAGDSHEN